MNKKVLIISASSRRGGNSDTLCDQFANGARKIGHTVEKIFLRDKTVKYCTGCYVCEISTLLPNWTDSPFTVTLIIIGTVPLLLGWFFLSRKVF